MINSLELASTSSAGKATDTKGLSEVLHRNENQVTELLAEFTFLSVSLTSILNTSVLDMRTSFVFYTHKTGSFHCPEDNKLNLYEPFTTQNTMSRTK